MAAILIEVALATALYIKVLILSLYYNIVMLKKKSSPIENLFSNFVMLNKVLESSFISIGCKARFPATSKYPS